MSKLFAAGLLFLAAYHGRGRVCDMGIALTLLGYERGEAMKSYLYALLFAFLLPLLSFAAPPDVGFSVDLATPTVPFEYTTFAGNTPSVPVSILTNGLPYDGFVGYSCELNYMANDVASSLKTITGTVDGNIATFQALTNSFPVHGDFFCEIFFSTTYGASKITGGQGMLHVNRSPSSGSYGSLNLMNRINWDITTSIGTVPWSLLTEPIFLASVAYNITAAMTNQWSVAYTNYGPRIGVLETGKTDLVTYNAHVAAQANTNINFDLRIGSNETFRITTQPATNVSLQDQITLNLTNQNATNTSIQLQIILNLTNQAATNIYFEDTMTNLQAQINAINVGTNVISRYYARTNAGEKVEVLAAGLGIVVTRTNELFNFAIPADVRIFSANLEIDGGETDSGIIRLAMGTADMTQGAIATMWIPSANGWSKTSPYVRKEIWAIPDPDNLNLIKVYGLGTVAGTIWGCHFAW